MSAIRRFRDMLAADAQLLERVENARGNAQEVAQIAGSLGVALSPDELEALHREVLGEGALSDQALDAIAGGISVATPKLAVPETSPQAMTSPEIDGLEMDGPVGQPTFRRT